MVRVKSRWIIFSVDFERDILLLRNNNNNNNNNNDTNPFVRNEYFPSHKELAHSIQDSVIQCFGEAVAAASLGTNLQIRFCDPATRIAIARVPRDYCSLVRSAMTLVTIINKKRVVLTTYSIHGTARTTKIAIIRLVTDIWRTRILSFNNNNNNYYYYKGDDDIVSSNEICTPSTTDRLCCSLEDTLKEITSNF